MKTGFDKFLHCLNLYIDLLEYPIIDDERRVKIYESVTLENGVITRATNNYHNKAWFSNVAVLMDFYESDVYILEPRSFFWAGNLIYCLYFNFFLHSIFL